MSEFDEFFTLDPEKRPKPIVKKKSIDLEKTKIVTKVDPKKVEKRIPDKTRKPSSDEIRTAIQLIVGKSARGKGIYTIKDTANALNKYLSEMSD